MIWILTQHLPIDFVRLGEFSSFMIPDGDLHGLIDVESRHFANLLFRRGSKV